MPRQKSLLTIIRQIIHDEVTDAITKLVGPIHTTSNARRKKRGKWRPGDPGRPPKAVAAQRK